MRVQLRSNSRLSAVSDREYHLNIIILVHVIILHMFCIKHARAVVCTREASDQFAEQKMALLGSKKRFIRKFYAYAL